MSSYSVKKIRSNTELEFSKTLENTPNTNIKSNFNYGLYLGKKLVMSVSFANLKHNMNYQWEIIRISSKEDIDVDKCFKNIWNEFVYYNEPHDCILNLDDSNIDLSNILIECGFKQMSDNLYSWVRECFVYRIDIPEYNKFYIGQTGTYDFDSYFGSGNELNRFYDENNISENQIVKTIIADNSEFLSYNDALDRELAEIQKYCEQSEDGTWIKKPEFKESMLNVYINMRQPSMHLVVCEECGAKVGKHKRNCSHYNEQISCPECGGTYNHKKTCSRYQPHKPCPECGWIDHHKKACSHYKAPKPCPECGGVKSHLKTCSKAKHCPECGAVNGHLKTCSKYKFNYKCPECGVVGGKHRLGCSQRKEMSICPECSGVNGKHKKSCSQYKPPENCCPYCGTTPGGLHKRDCPNYEDPGKCPECGYSLRSNKHAKTCSKYKGGVKRCPECDGYPGHHKDFCSKYIKCSECGSANGHHKKFCSQYKRKAS